MSSACALASSSHLNPRGGVDEVSTFFNLEDWDYTIGDASFPDQQSDTVDRDGMSTLLAFTHQRHDRLFLDSYQEPLHDYNGACDTYVNDWSGGITLEASLVHEAEPTTHFDNDIFELPHRATGSDVGCTDLAESNSSAFELESGVLPINSLDQIRCPQLSSADAPKSLKRSRITRAARKVLEEHFSANPYPDKSEILALSGATQLQIGTIKTWFCNTRSRKKGTNCESAMEILDHIGHASRPSSRLGRSAQPICQPSLDLLTNMSPIASSDSLERYLALSASEEAVSMEAIDAALPRELHLYALLDEEYNAASERGRKSRRALSVADSEGSRGSGRSYTSQNSFKSKDSRGSRRGRRTWIKHRQRSVGNRTQTLSAPVHPALVLRTSPLNIQHSLPEGADASLPRYYCTWPRCSARFWARWEWVRHEEAVHYQPYHWTCCLESADSVPIPKCFICGERNITTKHLTTQHFVPCSMEHQEHRVFLREDQLLQHLNGVHLQSRVSKRVAQDVLSAWKTHNHSIENSATRCGFCGAVFNTWEERKDHVSAHLQSTSCKSSWWPDRLPVVTAERNTLATDEAFACFSCDTEFDSVHLAVKTHSQCVSWSCRNLHDWHAIFGSTLTNTAGLLNFVCKLCRFTSGAYEKNDEMCLWILEEHAKEHILQECSQERFVDVNMFINHLATEHGAKPAPHFDRVLSSWKCGQKLTWSEDGTLTGTTIFPSLTSPLCSDRTCAPNCRSFQVSRRVP